MRVILIVFCGILLLKKRRNKAVFLNVRKAAHQKQNVLSDDGAQPLASNDNGNVFNKILYLGAYKYGVKK